MPLYVLRLIFVRRPKRRVEALRAVKEGRKEGRKGEEGIGGDETRRDATNVDRPTDR